MLSYASLKFTYDDLGCLRAVNLFTPLCHRAYCVCPRLSTWSTVADILTEDNFFEIVRLYKRNGKFHDLQTSSPTLFLLFRNLGNRDLLV